MGTAEPQATDWDLYYRRDPGIARLTRRITQRALVTALRAHSIPQPTVAELGGAASCVFDAVWNEVSPREYHVVDNNTLGLRLLKERVGEKATTHQRDILDLRLPEPIDVVFSLGLIEHFDEQGTRRAVLSHLEALKPEGIAIITFPTPTALYRATRTVIEAAGRWIFHDERPLWSTEVRRAIEGRGEVVEEKIIWPILLTQTMMVIRKLG